MKTLPFSSGSVGIVLETLLPDPWTCDREAFERIVRAASNVGFRSASIWPTHAANFGRDQVRAILDDAGVAVHVAEFLTGWANGPEAAVEDVDHMLDDMGALGARIMLAVSDSAAFDIACATDGFAALCERASRRGIRVALEFIPCRAVANLATAWEVVRGSKAHNGGIVFDMMHWHYQRGGRDLSVLHAIPGQHVHYVQLCDAAPSEAPAAENYINVALTARPAPGDGVVDIQAVLKTLSSIGAAPFFAMEVYNADLARQGSEAMARQLRSIADGLFD